MAKTGGKNNQDLRINGSIGFLFVSGHFHPSVANTALKKTKEASKFVNLES